MIRLDQADVIYKTEKAKFNAVVDDIVERHQIGQPVLVGTVSVEKSELLSQMLRRRGVPHAVLNAKFHAKEAEIIAQAGRKGSVTVATNMAGRGTDILLGGNPEYLAAAELRQRGVEPETEEYEAAWDDAVSKWKKLCDEEGEEVVDAGGLYVLGTERHESRRIDNQLRGRSGRQGDPGESRFYLSLQDELMRRFRAGAVEAVMDRLNIPEDLPIESKMVSRQIKSAQTQIEGQNAEIRKNVLKYDEVLNQQRTVIYAERKKVLDGEDLHDQIRNMLDDVVTAYVLGATAEGVGAEDWDLDKLWTSLKQLYPVSLTVDDLIGEAGGEEGLSPELLEERLKEDAHAAYDGREEELGAEALRELERQVLLAVIDRKWREHLYEMDYLQEGVGLRAYAQRDPLVEYQREGFDMFQQMLDGIKEEAVGFLFNLEVQVEESEAAAVDGAARRDPRQGPRRRSACRATCSTRRPRSTAPPGPGAVAVEQQESAPALGIGSGNGRTAGGRRGGARPARSGPSSGTPKSTGGTARAASGGGGALGVGSDSTGSAGGGGARRSGPASPTAAGARKPSPGQATAAGGPSRNAPCYCGSGKKYKRCHGAPGAA